MPSSTVSLFTPRWDDLYLTCSGCNNEAGTTLVPSEFDLSKYFPLDSLKKDV